MKLLEIKSRMIEAFFSTKGDGVDESSLTSLVSSLAKLIDLDPKALLGEILNETDDAIVAYRSLAKGSFAMGYICEGNNILFLTLRNGKRLSCINLTSPNKVERNCTFREVKEAFTELEDVIFKTCYIY